jgi:DNA (cytosine-5)-methyltransferase 1
VLENVPAITRMVTAEGIPVLDAIALYLSQGGYADYAALQRSLSFDPTARAGVRKNPKAEPEPGLDDGGEPAAQQLGLFSETP